MIEEISGASKAVHGNCANATHQQRWQKTKGRAVVIKDADEMVKDEIERETLASEMNRGRAAAWKIKLSPRDSARCPEINRNGGGIKSSSATKDDEDEPVRFINPAFFSRLRKFVETKPSATQQRRFELILALALCATVDPTYGDAPNGARFRWRHRRHLRVRRFLAYCDDGRFSALSGPDTATVFIVRRTSRSGSMGRRETPLP